MIPSRLTSTGNLRATSSAPASMSAKSPPPKSLRFAVVKSSPWPYEPRGLGSNTI